MAIKLPTLLRISGKPTSEDFGRLQDGIARVTTDIQHTLAPDWISLQSPFGNGWTSAAASAGSAGSVNGAPTAISYLLDASGFVRLRGVVSGGTASATATGTVFTLPAGYRPFHQHAFAAWNAATVYVVDNGDVRIVVGAGSVDLGGISFMAEQ